MTNKLIQPDEVTADFVPETREILASIEIETEGLVFDEDSGSWHYLNPMARVIGTVVTAPEPPRKSPRT